MVTDLSFLVSFPRSGSNFVQNVLRESGVCDAVSIYKADAKEDLGRNFKSHAVSMAYLVDEARRRLKTRKVDIEGAKIVWLVRDPRDAMISFLEYTRTRTGNDIEAEDFVERYDFFLASPIDRKCERRIQTSPISVGRAYAKHMNRWQEAAKRSNVLPVRYEDLLSSPEETFGKVFAHLGSEAELNMRALDLQVSQHSDEARARATAHSWKTADRSYAPLISAVERTMAGQLERHGY